MTLQEILTALYEAVARFGCGLAMLDKKNGVIHLIAVPQKNRIPYLRTLWLL